MSERRHAGARRASAASDAAGRRTRLRQYQVQLLERMQAARANTRRQRQPTGRADRRRALPARPDPGRRDRAGAAVDGGAADAGVVPGPGQYPRQPGRRDRPGALPRAGATRRPARDGRIVTFAGGTRVQLRPAGRARVRPAPGRAACSRRARACATTTARTGRRWTWRRWSPTNAFCTSGCTPTRIAGQDCTSVASHGLTLRLGAAMGFA